MRESNLLLRDYTSLPLSSKLSPQEIDLLRRPPPTLTHKRDLQRYLKDHLPLVDKAKFCNAVGKYLGGLKVMESRAITKWMTLGMDYVGRYSPVTKTIHVNFEQIRYMKDLE